MNLHTVLMTAFLLGGGDPATTDLDKLQGTWEMVSMETEGHDVAAEDFKDLDCSLRAEPRDAPGRRSRPAAGNCHAGSDSETEGDQYVGSGWTLRGPDRARHL